MSQLYRMYFSVIVYNHILYQSCSKSEGERGLARLPICLTSFLEFYRDHHIKKNLSFAYTANGERQIQVETFSK